MSDKIIEEFMEKLDGSKSGMFATKSSLAEANEYAVSILSGVPPEQVPQMASMAIAIYHNTLVEGMKGVLRQVIEDNAEGETDV